ncbi:SON protein [Anaerotruncus sp. 1XD22-93]|nr:SON protein [Lachnospiraceae bacterium]NBI77087.1 SON protein [Lachnospiraceae bacterium]RKJ70707.1 SON protein [Anaerotruncus sp. 1XD22-93]
MRAEKEFLIRLLKEAGVKSAVYTSMKKLKTANEMHLGAVLVSGESFTRSKHKKIYTDEHGNRKARHKVWERVTEIKAVIADADEGRCEDILGKFLGLMPQGIYVDGNWVSIEVGKADWLEEGDSILRAKVAVEIPVTFGGGLYKDEDTGQMKVGSIQAEKEG